MNLTQLREYIRTQLDMDEEELPNALLDTYLNEAFLRTISMENRWPFFEKRWGVAQIAGESAIVLPADCDPVGITSLQDMVSGVRLMQISNEIAEDNFVGAASVSTAPLYYSIYAGAITVWPPFQEGAAGRGYNLRGQRFPKDWIALGASAEPDCDVRLHQLLAHYAIALAYAQQEDEVLEDTYMKRWQASYLVAHSAICSPRHHRPLIFNGGIPFSPSYNPVVWGPPVAP